MKLTWSWLQEHVEVSASIQEVCHRLTMLGLELESVQDAGAKLAPFVVAQIVEASPHPDANKLQVCRVDAGDGGPLLQVVCGAPNARAGLKTALGRPGAVVPASGVTLKLAQVRGVESQGMLCSGRELSLSDAHEGIMELDADAVVGAPLATALGLNDPVIDLSVTPNRVDCMGVRGIAREVVASGLGRWVAASAASAAPVAPVQGAFPCPVSVKVEADSGCAVFASRLIRGVKNGPSPAWMQAKLKAVGLRPISALVDITNYLTLDRCRPLHVFDAAKLTGGLVVKAAIGGETLSALNGKTYTLEAGMTVIADDAGAQSLGGVVGGEPTGVSDDTTDVLLECAWFEPSRVTQTGRALKIDSDARFRFERGVDPASTLEGLELATRLILDICGGEPSAAQVAGEEAQWRRVIRLHQGRIAQLVGLAVPADEACRILQSLGFTVTAVADQADAWDVSPPSWRRDVEGEADLVEEVARVYGYDNIPTVMPTRGGGFPKPALDPRQRNAVRVRRLLASRGLVEAVTWSFIDSKVAARFTDGPLNPALFIANPIAAQFDYLRPSVLPALLQAVARNEAYGQPDVALFEVGPQFHDPAPGGQHLMASGVRAGAVHDRHWLSPKRAVDAYDAKADALAALALCGVDGAKAQLIQQAPAYYHPGRSARLQLGPKNILAVFGELHPEVLKALDIRAASVVAFEVFLDRAPLPKGAKGPRDPYVRPQFPAVSRDLAFTVSRDVTAERVISSAKAVDKKLIEAVEVFDVYEGEHMEAGKKSIAFSVRLQPADKTLTDAEIEATRQAIIARVAKDTQGELRA